MSHKLLARILRYLAFNKGRFRFLYLRVCNPDGREYAEYLRRHGNFYAMGDNCRINQGANITDPAYVRLANNVSLSDCTLLGHDGVVAVLNEAYGVRLDSVGKIDLKDNVFVGHGATIMPGVTIGPNAIVAAGSLVTKDVAEGDVVGGVPARRISTVSDLLKRLQDRTDSLPWSHIIRNRDGAFDPDLECKLVEMRSSYFFSEKQERDFE